MTVTHSAVVVVPDDPAFPVGSDEWNAAHTGTIDDTMHGSRGSALHADSHANTNDPSAGQKAALAGTSGTPGAGNAYVTDADTRNTNARVPSAHHASHDAGGGDAMVIDAVAATGSLRTLGTGAQQATAGNDTRLTNARTPTAHVATHEPDGSDAYFIAMQPATNVTVPTNNGLVVVGPYNVGASVLLTLSGTSRMVVL